MSETIAVVFEPLGSAWGKTYYHETLIYTNSQGVQQYASAYPGTSAGGAPSTVASAAVDASTGAQSPYGNLQAESGDVSTLNASAFQRLFATNGTPNDTQIVASGADLSSQWASILNTYQNVVNANIPYSPLTQNSNSVATTALQDAGLSLPSETGLFGNNWTPASDNLLPVDGREADNSGMSVTNNGNGDATIADNGPTPFQIAFAVSQTASQSQLTASDTNITDDSNTRSNGSVKEVVNSYASNGDLLFQQTNFVSPSGSDETVVSGSGDNISLSSSKIYLSAGASAAINGTNDTLSGVAGSGSNVYVSGLGNTYTNVKESGSTGGKDTVNVAGYGSTDTIHTNPNVNLGAPDETVDATGENTTITGFDGGDSVTAVGDAHDTVYFEGGAGNTYSATPTDDSNGANRVELYGDGTSATINNTPVVSLDGNDEGVTFDTSGVQVYVPSGESGDVIEGHGYTVYEGGNDQVTLEGSGYNVVNDPRKDSNGTYGTGTNGAGRGGTAPGGGPTTTAGAGGPTGGGPTGGGPTTGGTGGTDDYSRHARALRRRSGAHTSVAKASAASTAATVATIARNAMEATATIGTMTRHTSAKQQGRQALNRARAAIAGADLPGAATTAAFEGPKWEAMAPAATIAGPTSTSAPTITWSFATGASDKSGSFSGYIGSSYKATVDKAIQAWAAASGLSFVEVPASASADIRIGWGDLGTSSTGLLGKTTYQASGGAFRPGAIIRLEDPSQDALMSVGGQATYVGTGATLYQVILHEIGHALGLADDSDTSSVMYAESLKTNRTLDATDIKGIESLYGISPTEASSGSSTTLAATRPPGVSSSPLVGTSAATTALGVNQMIQAMASFTPGSSAAIALGASASANAAPTLAAAAGHH